MANYTSLLGRLRAQPPTKDSREVGWTIRILFSKLRVLGSACFLNKGMNTQDNTGQDIHGGRPEWHTLLYFYPAVCGMLPSHGTCVASLTFPWLARSVKHWPVPRARCLQLAPLSFLFAEKECPALFARAGLIGNFSFASTQSSTYYYYYYYLPLLIYRFEFLSKPLSHVGLVGIWCLPFGTVSSRLWKWQRQKQQLIHY